MNPCIPKMFSSAACSRGTKSCEESHPEDVRLRRLADAARALRDSMPNNLFADAVVTKEFWKALAALDKEAT